MIIIPVDSIINDLVKEYAPKFDLGGRSNLSALDLAKASREDYQYTGLFGELAWYRHRYGEPGIQKWKEWADFKLNRGTGDNGEDDNITFRGTARLLDVKTSWAASIERVKQLCCVVAPKELHDNMVYVQAFAIGSERQKINDVVLAGWCLNEDLKEPWYFDKSKFAVRFERLTPPENLTKYF